MFIPTKIGSEGKPSPRMLDAKAVTITSDDSLKQQIIVLLFKVQTPLLQDVMDAVIRILSHSGFENVKLKV